MLVATWKPGFSSLFKADAQKVALEITGIGESATAAQIVELAKDRKTELHKCFEWNDTVAAEKWRLHTARQVVCNLVIKQTEEEEAADKPTLRVFYKTKDHAGYRPTQLIMQNKDEYQQLLEEAREYLRVFKSRYHSLAEYDQILALID